ncbi:DUF3363 domain-containing protein [Sphingomonas sp. IW22]|uniref:DUF3363 domain-containing protein n=1 Tax=Sphingomonas sp. IW22 TaxID=3242489 RepID=UPI00351FB4B7
MRPIRARDAGFGRELRNALASPSVDLQKAMAAGSEWLPARSRFLRRCELLRIAGGLRSELDKSFVEGGRNKIDGRLMLRAHLLSGRYALVKRGREFLLSPHIAQYLPVCKRPMSCRTVAGNQPASKAPQVPPSAIPSINPKSGH